MAIEITKFEPVHLDGLLLQPAQSYFQSKLDDPSFVASFYEPGFYAQTCLIDGRPVGCAGVTRLARAPWIGQGWCLFGAVPPRAWVAIVRAARRGLALLEQRGLTRIEGLVLPDFWPGVRFAKLLGMEFVGAQPNYIEGAGVVWQFVRCPPPAR